MMLQAMVTLVVGVFGFGGLIASLIQRMNADSHAEWWERAAWAADHVIVGQSEGADVGLVVLEALQDSPLASASDRELLEGGYGRYRRPTT